MDFRLLIARRYLFSRRRVTLISIISGISVGGVALGVAALVVVLSVMNGFYDVVRALLVSYDPHVRIEATAGRGLAGADSLLAIVRQDPRVVSATPYVEGKALVTSEGPTGALNQVVTVRGVDVSALDASVAESIVAGRFDLARREGLPGLVMGAALASRSGLFAAPSGNDGSRVAVLTAQALERALVQFPFGLPAQQTFVLRGTYALEPTYDDTHVFVDLAEGQRLFRLDDGRVSGLDLRLADLNHAARVQADLARRLDGERFTVRTWYDLQASLYSVMQLEKWAASVILFLIVVVAAFNIVGALTMTVLEKRRDLGVLQAMGVSRRDVRRIFLLQGLLVGGVGTGLGLAVGLGLALVQDRFGLVRLADTGSFVIEAYPVAIRAGDVALVAAFAVGLCALAALYPAARASAVEPARAVQEGA
ncbi:MAG: FtsX-like permease family protein [Rubricoccaceae bacterium]